LVLKRIAQAQNVKFTRSLSEVTGSDFMPFDQSQVTNLKGEIENLRILSQRFRVFRALSRIASLRFYTTKIESFEQDRLMECSQLWESKREFELLSAQMHQNIQQAYLKLANCEIEIVRLSQQLENEKQSVVQLVHWKAMNSKKEEQIQRELKAIESAGEVNIGKLAVKGEKGKESMAYVDDVDDFIICPLTSFTANSSFFSPILFDSQTSFRVGLSISLC